MLVLKALCICRGVILRLLEESPSTNMWQYFIYFIDTYTNSLSGFMLMQTFWYFLTNLFKTRRRVLRVCVTVAYNKKLHISDKVDEKNNTELLLELEILNVA